MIYRNTFPEFLQSITIGPDPSFLEKNTTNCEFVSAFPQEVELMYDWKSVKRSSNPLNALRNFTKKFIVYGPDLDVQTLNFFVHKVNVFPNYYGDTIKDEVANAFNIVNNRNNPNTTYFTNNVDGTTTTGGSNIGGTVTVNTGGTTTGGTTIGRTYQGTTSGNINYNKTPNNTPIKGDFITNNTPIDRDGNFLDKLAQMMKTCKSPCNYFKPPSSSIGTLADFGRALSDSASVLGAAGSDLLHAPINIATNVYNKVKPMARTEFNKLKVLTENLYKDGVKPFFSQEDRERVKDNLSRGITPDTNFDRLPLTGDSQTYFSVSEAHSEVHAKVREQLGDCFRMFEHHQRYNPFDPTMNASYAKRKYTGVKNGDVKSLIDMFGSLAPAQYASEVTFRNALDCPKGDPDRFRYGDAKKRQKYDTYDGPSKGSESVVTAGGGANINASSEAAQSGSGLENVPTNGKVYEFQYGEVKLTAYGYANDECPDSGSEIGLGSRSNMIIPLKTIAVAPETLKSGMVKAGDVLIITCTDKKGNTFVERRQVGDTSGAGLMAKGGYKFLIDEFVPNKKQYPSKLADRSKDLKLTIQVADTKEPLAKWNPQEASQFAPMFISKTDWERVLKMGPANSSGFSKAKMNTEYIQYCKWSDGDPINQKILNSKGC